MCTQLPDKTGMVSVTVALSVSKKFRPAKFEHNPSYSCIILFVLFHLFSHIFQVFFILYISRSIHRDFTHCYIILTYVSNTFHITFNEISHIFLILSSKIQHKNSHNFHHYFKHILFLKHFSRAHYGNILCEKCFKNV